MKYKRWLWVYLVAAMPLGAHAKIFICKDASGHTLTSDRPIPECADRAVKEMDTNGMVRREIAAPLTPEQKKQKEIEEEKRKAEAAAAAEQKRADQAILARYRNESDIEAARKRNLDLIQEQMKRETATLTEAENNKKNAELNIEKAKQRKSQPSPALQAKLAEADQSVAILKKKIEEYQSQTAQINVKFDATLKRYRELTGVTASAK